MAGSHDSSPGSTAGGYVIWYSSHTWLNLTMSVSNLGPAQQVFSRSIKKHYSPYWTCRGREISVDLLSGLHGFKFHDELHEQSDGWCQLIVKHLYLLVHIEKGRKGSKKSWKTGPDGMRLPPCLRTRGRTISKTWNVNETLIWQRWHHWTSWIVHNSRVSWNSCRLHYDLNAFPASDVQRALLLWKASAKMLYSFGNKKQAG